MVKQQLKTLRNIIIIGISTIILAGCASTPSTKVEPLPVPSPQNIQNAWHTHEAIITPIKSWEASGVIGIRVKDKGEGANLFWRVTDQNKYIIQIYGTGGIGAISIKGRSDGSIIFKNSNGKETFAKNIQALMQKELGWSVPVEGLYYWGRGIPAPIASKQMQLNDAGLIASLEQSGWNIKYDEYYLAENKYPLPSKIELSRGDMTIKIVIKSWLVGE